MKFEASNPERHEVHDDLTVTARERYAGVTAEDLRHLTGIIDEIYKSPRWHEYKKLKRIAVVLAMFAELSQGEGEPFPTIAPNYMALTDKVRADYKLVRLHVSWLVHKGFMVRLPFDGERERLAFRWHVDAVPQGDDGNAPE